MKTGNLLLFAVHPTSLRVMLPFGQYLKDQRNFNPVLVALRPDRVIREEIQKAGLEYVIPSVSSLCGESLGPDSSPFVRRVFAVAKRSLGLDSIPLFMIWKRYREHSRQLKQELLVAKRVFDRYRPRAIVLPDDRSVRALPSIKIARERRIASVVVPVSFSNQIGVSLRRATKEEYCASGDTATLWNRYIALRYPQQVHEFRKKELLFYPGVLVKALGDYGMLPPNPWVQGGGNSDYLAVSAYDAKEQAIRQGVPENKIHVTGHISHDVLYESFSNQVNIRTKIIHKYRFDPNKELIVCAVPHLAEHNMIPWDKHWEDVDVLTQTLGGTDQNVLLSLHPKSDPKRYAYLERKYNCRVAQEDLDQILVAAWLFVAGYSSTVRWAVLCAIPSIVIDFNHLGYDIYDHWDGVLKVNSPQMLIESLGQMFRDKAFYTVLKEKQRRASLALTNFDGNAHQRIYNLIEQAVGQTRG